jgi:hypothetical protein
MGVQIKLEDFGRSYDLLWPNWVTQLTYAGIRYVRARTTNKHKTACHGEVP